jgi:hypothetical protein
MRWGLLLLVAACSEEGRMASPFDIAVAHDLAQQQYDLANNSDGGQCQTPGTPAASDVQLAPEFASSYSAYLLGPVPGVPSPLGGTVLKHDDPNTLLIAGGSEDPSGAIYAIRVQRDGCNHIVSFVGTATKLSDNPNVDANLVYGPNHLMVYTEWPLYTLAQMLDGATAPSTETDLTTLGIPTTNDQGPGGVGFVPMGLGSAGELRIVTWPAGHWFHVGVTLQASGLYHIDSLTEKTQLANNPGGFAYVPAGSAGFTKQSLIVAEWNQSSTTLDRVAVYEVDDAGDPVVSTRREFMSKFPRPWGAYFEPLTGDYLFLTWGAGNDRVYIVQGFVPPQPVF